MYQKPVCQIRHTAPYLVECWLMFNLTRVEYLEIYVLFHMERMVSKYHYSNELLHMKCVWSVSFKYMVLVLMICPDHKLHVVKQLYRKHKYLLTIMCFLNQGFQIVYANTTFHAGCKTSLKIKRTNLPLDNVIKLRGSLIYHGLD